MGLNQMIKIRIIEYIFVLAFIVLMIAQVNEFEPELVNNLAIKARSILMD